MRLNICLFMLAIGSVLAQQSAPRIDKCGFRGNIHDCHCANRVERIQEADIGTCDDIHDQKLHDACMKHALAGHDHCSIAERSTEWDRDQYGEEPYPEGDNVSSPMGEYCKRSCSKHRCACSEEKCDFGMSKDDSAQADREERGK